MENSFNIICVIPQNIRQVISKILLEKFGVKKDPRIKINEKKEETDNIL
jgi:hypothetical protein